MAFTLQIEIYASRVTAMDFTSDWLGKLPFTATGIPLRFTVQNLHQ